MKHLLVGLLFLVATSGAHGDQGHLERAKSSVGRPIAKVVELDASELKGLTEKDQILTAFQDWLKKKFPESNKKILVKFGASWCGPCRALHPQIESFAAKKSAEYEVVNVDLDEYGNLAEALKYGGTVPALFELLNGAGTDFADPNQKIGPIKGIPAIPNYLKTR